MTVAFGKSLPPLCLSFPIFKTRGSTGTISEVPLSPAMHSCLELPVGFPPPSTSLSPPPSYSLTPHSSAGLTDTALQTATGPGQQLYHVRGKPVLDESMSGRRQLIPRSSGLGLLSSFSPAFPCPHRPMWSRRAPARPCP